MMHDVHHDQDGNLVIPVQVLCHILGLHHEEFHGPVPRGRGCQHDTHANLMMTMYLALLHYSTISNLALFGSLNGVIIGRWTIV
jgi:hypothetical protein